MVWQAARDYISYCLLNFPFWGRLADRKGRKITLIRSSFGMALCNVLIAFQTTPEGVVLIRLIQGLVSGFYSAKHYINCLRVPHRTNWLGFRSIGIGQSSRIARLGPLLGGYIADTVVFAMILSSSASSWA